MSDESLFTPVSPEEPYLLSASRVGAFGDDDHPVEFSFGGNSTLPTGEQNPEDYVALPESLFASGVVKPGQGIRIVNPATKKSIVAVARHSRVDSGTAMDLAPHTILELGGTKGLIVDFRPVKNYPIAQYSRPYASPEEVIQAGEMPQGQGLQDVSVSGAMTVENEEPGMRNASFIDSPTAAGGSPRQKIDPSNPQVISENEDGSMTFDNGETIFPDGRSERKIAGGAQILVVPADGSKPYRVPARKSGEEIRTEEEIRKNVMTPSMRLSALREERKAYSDNQATIAMYGKGQMPGMHQIKGRLDSLLEAVGGDYSKLSPQQLATFVFQFSKFNDPNSAVLLGEYNAAASRLGLGDRAKLALERAMKGDVISDKQAEDIYKTITIAHQNFKEEHFRDLKEREDALKMAGVDVKQLGVPPSVMKEYSEWKIKSEEESGGSPEAPKKEAVESPLKSLKPGQVITDKSGKKFKLKEGGDPLKAEDYELLP